MVPRIRYPSKRGKGKQPWTDEEDKILVDALMELYSSGKFLSSPIVSEYVAAVERLMDPDKRCFYSSNAIRYRMRNIKIETYLVHEMVTGLHMSGFSWDPKKLCVIAEDEVWNEYIKSLPLAAQFRTKPFPHYYDLRTIFIRDTTKGFQADDLEVKGEDIVEENQLTPCLKGEELHISGNASSFYGDIGSQSSKRKRNEGDDLNDNCVESKVANYGSNAVIGIMEKVATQIQDLCGLTLDERIMAMSVIGRSEPLSVMFDQLDEKGKVRMAQMVAAGAIN